MSFTGDFVDAETALRIGLVNAVHAPDALLPRAVEIATAIVALARKLLVALWKYVTHGVVIEGAVMKRAGAEARSAMAAAA